MTSYDDGRDVICGHCGPDRAALDWVGTLGFCRAPECMRAAALAILMDARERGYDVRDEDIEEFGGNA